MIDDPSQQHPSAPLQTSDPSDSRAPKSAESATADSAKDAANRPASSGLDTMSHEGVPRDLAHMSGNASQLDPELIALPRVRTRVGPVLAVSMVVFCVYLLAQLTADLRFSQRGDEPLTFASAGDLLAATSDLGTDVYVELPAVPDRSYVSRVRQSPADAGFRVLPVQGTNGRLLLHIDGHIWRNETRYDENYRGRLRPLSAMPFADELRQHWAEHKSVARFIGPDDARAALAESASLSSGPSGPTESGGVRQRVLVTTGDHIAIAADTAVRVTRRRADRVDIEVIASEALPDAQAWSAALADIGLVPAGATAKDGPLGSWVFTVPEGIVDGADGAGPRATADEVVAAVQSQLETAKLFTARALAVEEELPATWGQLSLADRVGMDRVDGDRADDDGAALAVGDVRVPWSEVVWLMVDVPRTWPGGPSSDPSSDEDGDGEIWVLLVGEQPELYWYALPLCGLLALGALLFLWALIRTMRESKS